jgi:hypothetical protein
MFIEYVHPSVVSGQGFDMKYLDEDSGSKRYAMIFRTTPQGGMARDR